MIGDRRLIVGMLRNVNIESVLRVEALCNGDFDLFRKLVVLRDRFAGGSGQVHVQPLRVPFLREIEVQDDHGEPSVTNSREQLLIGYHTAASQQLGLKQVGKGRIEAGLHQVASTVTEGPRTSEE